MRTSSGGTLLLLLAMSAAATSTWAADHYVSTAGSDATGDGSIGNPWRTIQFAISDPSTVNGDVIHVAAGTYNERLTINKSLDLRGAQYGVDPTLPLARTNPLAESIVDPTGLPVPNPDVLVEIPLGTTNVLVSGFTLIGGQTGVPADKSAVRCWDDHITIQDDIVDAYVGVLYKGNDDLDVLRNRITANKTGIIVQPNAATDVTVTGNSIVRGSSPAGDETGIYLTTLTTAVVQGNTVTGFLSGRAFQASNFTQLTASRNSFTGNRDAISIFGNSTFITITENDLSNNTRYGVNIKGADIAITNNFIRMNGNAGVSIDKNTITTERVAVNNNDVTGNTNYDIIVLPAVTATVDGTCNWYGTTDYSTVSGRVSGALTYTPYLSNGTDADLVTPGFQPGGTCTVPVEVSKFQIE